MGKRWPNSNGTLKERFDEKYCLDEVTGCWNWIAAKTHQGYGKIHVNGKTTGAHRVSYELYVGQIPDGMIICHKCDNTSCVNYSHFFLGTYSDNTQDAIKKGRWRKPDPHPSVAYYKHHACRCNECKALYAEYTKNERMVLMINSKNLRNLTNIPGAVLRAIIG